MSQTLTTPAEVLRAARALIETPERWCRGAWARSAHRRPVLEASAKACSFCALGAVNRVAPSWNLRGQAHGALFHSLPKFPSVHQFNDARSTTHADILALYDRAIALAETEKAEVQE